MAHRHSIDIFDLFYENLEKQIEEFFSRIERPAVREGEIIPPVDIFETDDLICIELELPGVRKEDINISVTGSTLHLEATKTNDLKEGQRVSHICLERGFGKVKRKIELNSACDTNRIKARLEDGLLIIKIPKIEDRRCKTKKIEIEDNEG